MKNPNQIQRGEENENFTGLSDGIRSGDFRVELRSECRVFPTDCGAVATWRYHGFFTYDQRGVPAGEMGSNFREMQGTPQKD